MWSDGGEVMRGRPLAFIKKGTLSALERRDGVQTIWVDAINNEGFSGGPLVFRTSTSDAFKIAGVVNKFRTSHENVFDSEEIELICMLNTILVSYVLWTSNTLLT